MGIRCSGLSYDKCRFFFFWLGVQGFGVFFRPVAQAFWMCKKKKKKKILGTCHMLNNWNQVLLFDFGQVKKKKFFFKWVFRVLVCL